MLPTAKKIAPMGTLGARHQQERTQRVRCGDVRDTRPAPRLRQPQQSQVARDVVERTEHAFSNATDQAQHRKLVVLVARDPVQRHGQHEGREAFEQRNQDGQAHVCRILADAREFRGITVDAPRLVHQQLAAEYRSLRRKGT